MSSNKHATLSSGHTIPTLGYGTWQAAPGQVGAGVYEALKAGYRHLDLAKVYGNQREVATGIKKALSEISGLCRDEIFITSKLWNNHHHPQDVEDALDDTLAELELDYLDLYLVHFPVAFRRGDELFPLKPDNELEVELDQTIKISETWEAMTKLPKSKARTIGVSNFSIEQLETIICDTGIIPAVNQVERHPKLNQMDLISYCDAKKIHVTAYSAFGNNSFGFPLLIQAPEIEAIARRLSESQNCTISTSQVILSWAQIGGHSVIPKSITPARIRENFQDTEIDEEAVRAIDNMGKDSRRYNIPATYSPRWDINIFDDDKEADTTHKVVLNL